MGKILPLTELQAIKNRDWNAGYSDGYNRRKRQPDASSYYYTGYYVGLEDKLEDLEAVETGEFDHMSESERELIYGDEKDRV